MTQLEKTILKEFDDGWRNPQGITVLDKPLREFILDAMRRQREEILKKLPVKKPADCGENCTPTCGYNKAIEDCRKAIEE